MSIDPWTNAVVPLFKRDFNTRRSREETGTAHAPTNVEGTGPEASLKDVEKKSSVVTVEFLGSVGDGDGSLPRDLLLLEGRVSMLSLDQVFDFQESVLDSEVVGVRPVTA